MNRSQQNGHEQRPPARMRWFMRVTGMLLGAAWLAGCASSPVVKYYVLTPVLTPAPTESAEAGAPVVEIARVRVAEYLMATRVAERPSSNAVAYADTHRWSEPMDQAVRAVMRENLGALLPGIRWTDVQAAGAGAASGRLNLEIVRLDGVRGQRAMLTGYWSLTGPGGATKVPSRRIQLDIKTDGDSFGSLAAAESRLLGDWAREMAPALKTALSKPPPAP